jgi:RNA polymerase sigma-70 factor (sigma-E family)
MTPTLVAFVSPRRAPILRPPPQGAAVEESARRVPSEIGVAEGAFARSFVELYEDQFPSMVRLAVALTGSEALAEDLVQDAFVRVHAHWERVVTPTAYLRRAVVNACRSSQRRQARERERALAAVEPSVELGADELFDALERLPYRQRAAIVLRFYEGLPDADVAEALGCRVGTVASLVHRGLGDLRKVIER